MSYLQLAHNEWDPAVKTSRTKVLYSFGRADQLDRAGIERLIAALTRVVGVEAASSGRDRARVVGVPGLEFVESRPLGGAWLLDGLWHRLGIDTLLRRLAAGTRRDPIVERVLFALVANRALAPSSKLAATSWVAHDVHVPGLDQVSDDACYRAMDWLIKVEDKLARGVFDAVAHLLNLEVDLIFFEIIRLIPGLGSRWPRRCCCFAVFECTDFFFLAADFHGDGVEGLCEVVDAVGQAGEGEQFAVAGAVGVDDRAELVAAVAGGAADAGGGGDGGEGDVGAGSGEGLAGAADAVGIGGRVGVGHGV